MKDDFVYIMANRLRTALYIGVTGNLVHRVWEHRQGVVQGFTEKYRCHDLVYFESCSDVRSAITREKQLKGWRRTKKDELVQSSNPGWRNLGDEILDPQGAPRGPSASLHSARDDSGERVLRKKGGEPVLREKSVERVVRETSGEKASRDEREGRVAHHRKDPPPVRNSKRPGAKL